MKNLLTKFKYSIQADLHHLFDKKVEKHRVVTAGVDQDLAAPVVDCLREPRIRWAEKLIYNLGIHHGAGFVGKIVAVQYYLNAGIHHGHRCLE